MGLGRTQLFGGASTGKPISVLANVTHAKWHPIGVKIAWGSVTAVSEDTTIPIEGLLVKDGQKYLRYGQVICRLTAAHAQTVTVSGTPTGGSFSYNAFDPATGNSAIITVPYNAAVSAHQTLLDAFFGSGNTVVSGSGALPGNVHTITLAGRLRYAVLPLLTSASNDLTGGTTPAAAYAVSAGATAGEWGPYDDTASDGRQTLTQGQCAILDRTITQDDLLGTGFVARDTDMVGALVGGTVWRDRVLANDSDASLAAGPLWSALIAVLPEIQAVHSS